MPVVAAGQFACVYKVTTGQQAAAVRCFTREVKDQQQRYGWLHDYLSAVLPESFVNFQYLENGIKVKGAWYPIVKMDWADGQPLNLFVKDNLGRPDALSTLAARWRGATASLRGLDIAHNDLQHGNVMVGNDGRLRLVDYDGIFLPRFQGQSSPETGHKNYQHPQRTAANYNAQIDNFPALAIYLSLLALRIDPRLWDRFYNDDNLLLTQRDYADPGQSECLKALQQSADGQVRLLAARLAEFCKLPVDQVPDLESVLQGRSAPLSPPTTPSPVNQAVGGYRPRPRPQPQPVNTLITCPQCHNKNDQGLIYCINPLCMAPLLPNNLTCRCGARIPANARYCFRCGRPQGQRATANAPARQPAARTNPAPRQPANPPKIRPAPPSRPVPAAKTCTNCRTQAPATAKFCNRCGTAL